MSRGCRGLSCRALAFLAMFAAPPLAALDLRLPDTAEPLAALSDAPDSHALPIGAYSRGKVPVKELEGRITRRSWRIPGGGTTLEILAPLRDQLESSGHDILFQCRDRDCGGFDFRFAIEVIPAPGMYVDLHDFRFLSARRDADAISLLVSRGEGAAFVQMIAVSSADAPAIPVADASRFPTGGDLATGLAETGHVVLDGLDFASGADRLGPGPHAALNDLARALRENAGLRIALVGHTDNTGAQAANLALSRRRAEAVRRRLLDLSGAAGDRILAEGVGPFAPRASNLTPEGRALNRRVEAVLLAPG